MFCNERKAVHAKRSGAGEVKPTPNPLLNEGELKQNINQLKQILPKSSPKGEVRWGLLYYNMKKNYTSPLAAEVNVEAESMLATSLKLDGDKEVDTSAGGQLSGGRRGSWGNLWN